MSTVIVLGRIDVESGVSAFDGSAFCRIGAVDENGKEIGFGQLPPDEVRGMALQWLGAAEAAEADAALFAELIEIGMDQQTISGLILALRHRRTGK